MNISPNEAEEALAAIHKVTQKTRRSIAGGSVTMSLMITGVVWLIGYACTQFLSGPIVAYIWIGLSVAGSLLAVVLGTRMGRRLRSPSTGVYMKRIGLFWLLLVVYAAAAIAVARPADGKQLTTLIVLFIMLGQLAMSLPFTFALTWWAVPVTALVLIGYFFVYDYYYLWMAVLGGGGMIALALYIRARW